MVFIPSFINSSSYLRSLICCNAFWHAASKAAFSAYFNSMMMPISASSISMLISL